MPESGRLGTETYDLIVVGGSVGCLVAAAEAGRMGKRVRLFLPERDVGSGFAARPFDGRRLDVGTRLFDLNDRSGAAVPTDLAGYRVGNDYRPYMRFIRRFVEELLEGQIKALPTTLMSFAGTLVPDFLATLDLSTLPSLVGKDALAVIFKETEAILDADPAHPATLGRNASPDLSGIPYEAASLANHGDTFHRLLIAPYSTKVYPSGWKSVPADLRHKIWSPLLYAKTINQACRGTLFRGREPLSFHTVEGADFGVFVDRLLARIEGCANLKVSRYGRLLQIARSGGAHLLSFDGPGAPYLVRGPLALGLSIADLAALDGGDPAIDQLTIGLAWVEVPEDDLLTDASYITVHQADNPAYRISFGGSGAPDGWRLINVELTPRLPRQEYGRGVPLALERAGLLASSAKARLLDGLSELTIPAPTLHNRARLGAAKVALAERGVIATFIGAAGDMACDQLNDHILQGLALAQEAHAATETVIEGRRASA